MFVWPMSSPMMTRILGLAPLADRCAAGAELGLVPWARAPEVSPVAAMTDAPLRSIALRFRRVPDLVSLVMTRFPDPVGHGCQNAAACAIEAGLCEHQEIRSGR